MKMPCLTSRATALGVCWLAALGMFLGPVRPAQAALQQRFATDDRANFVLIGNTTGLDCRDANQEKPLVGDVPVGVTGLFTCKGLLPDLTKGDDILWRSDDPQNGRAVASGVITPATARSTAVLNLPAGAKVLHAQLYWAAQRVPLLGGGQSVVVERPGKFSIPVTADTVRGSTVFPLALIAYYQSTADITGLVQERGSGAYRISGIDSLQLNLQQLDTLFIGWNMVVFYSLGTEPPRNLTLYDGLEQVSSAGSAKTTVNLTNLTVPAGAVNAKLGVVAYGANSELTGDALLVNGTPVSNAHNPANNFFNRSSTVLGALGPQVGDLPQFSGRPGSISGIDMDVVDISSAVTNGATQLAVEANTTQDLYFVGSLASAIGTVRPVLGGTTKTVTNISRSDGRFLPGDILEYTIATQNVGNDPATKVVVADVLPAKVTFSPGSISLVSGPVTGPQTDAAGDDQAEYSTATRTITARLGTCATPSGDCSLAVNQAVSFKFRVTINVGATGSISNQASISANSTTAPGSPAVSWPTGNGQQPNAPTVITVTTCASSADCTPQAPYCDTTLAPPQCVCRTTADCSGGYLCNPLTKQCTECLPGMLGNCNTGTVGGACLGNNTCGCQTNNDCGGRLCNTATGVCAAVNADLGLTLTRTPAGSTVAPGTTITYQLGVTNKGASPLTGAQLGTSITPSTQPISWTCTSAGGAQCPAASGNSPLLTLPTVPAGGSLQFTYTTTAASDPASGAVDFTATVLPPRGYVDTSPADNTVSDSVLVGMTSGGPDLSVTVIAEPSPTTPAVNYTINVTNHGPGAAPGATVTYDIPAGTTVEIIGGEGWSCSQQNTQVVCTRTAPIAEGETTSAKFVVYDNAGQAAIPVKVVVTGSDAAGNSLVDPNPADNTVDTTTRIGPFKIAGGGLGCTFSAGPSHVGATAAAGLLLVAMLTFSRRRRARA